MISTADQRFKWLARAEHYDLGSDETKKAIVAMYNDIAELQRTLKWALESKAPKNYHDGTRCVMCGEIGDVYRDLRHTDRCQYAAAMRLCE